MKQASHDLDALPLVGRTVPVLAGADVYLHYPAGYSGARLSAAQLERLLAVRGTHRNWRTVAKLAELAADA